MPAKKKSRFGASKFLQPGAKTKGVYPKASSLSISLSMRWFFPLFSYSSRMTVALSDKDCVKKSPGEDTKSIMALFENHCFLSWIKLASLASIYMYSLSGSSRWVSVLVLVSPVIYLKMKKKFTHNAKPNQPI